SAQRNSLAEALRRSLSRAEVKDSGQAPRNPGRGGGNPGLHPGYDAALLSSVRCAHETERRIGRRARSARYTSKAEEKICSASGSLPRVGLTPRSPTAALVKGVGAEGTV